MSSEQHLIKNVKIRLLDLTEISCDAKEMDSEMLKLQAWEHAKQ